MEGNSKYGKYSLHSSFIKLSFEMAPASSLPFVIVGMCLAPQALGPAPRAAVTSCDDAGLIVPPVLTPQSFHQFAPVGRYLE